MKENENSQDKDSANSSQDIHEQWLSFGQRFYSEIPSFGHIWNMAIDPDFQYENQDSIDLLRNYLQSYSTICQQTLFSINCLKSFCRREMSNVVEFYVSHYIYDFLGRIKTATDLLALILNHIFEFGLPKKYCSLEKGALMRKLNNKEPNDMRISTLNNKLSKFRNEWLNAFTELRDLVIHRNGLKLCPIYNSDVGQSLIQILTGELLGKTDEREILEKFFSTIKTSSTSEYGTVDPLILCEEIWTRLAILSENIFNECEPYINDFILSRRI